jgi:hypothetical protein
MCPVLGAKMSPPQHAQFSSCRTLRIQQHVKEGAWVNKTANALFAKDHQASESAENKACHNGESNVDL